MHAFFVAFICQLDELTWVQLSSILEFFDFGSFRNVKKNLGLNHHLSTYLELKGYYVHFRDHSKFWSKIKTNKSQGLLLGCTQVNSSSWQINVTFVIMLPPCFSFCWMGYFPIPSKVRSKSDANHIFYHMAGHHYIYNADLNLVNWWNFLLDLVNFCKKELWEV